VLSITLVECLQGAPADANVNRFLRLCEIVTAIPEPLARNAARLRALARTGSAVDALLVAASRGSTVITGDKHDCNALAAHAGDVRVITI
jgi:hypothetical protein